jgi:heme-degrading monooxygenase HmoA
MATTPQPPYYAVIFTAHRTDHGDADYAAAAARMESLAAETPGYLGVESARGLDRVGITVSYWRDEAAIDAWRSQPEHLDTQAQGRHNWYDWYELRVARVERSRSFEAR